MLQGWSWTFFSLFSLLATLLYYAGVLYYFQKYKSQGSSSGQDVLVQSEDKLSTKRSYVQDKTEAQTHSSDPASLS